MIKPKLSVPACITDPNDRAIYKQDELNFAAVYAVRMFVREVEWELHCLVNHVEIKRCVAQLIAGADTLCLIKIYTHSVPPEEACTCRDETIAAIHKLADSWETPFHGPEFTQWHEKVMMPIFDAFKACAQAMLKKYGEDEATKKAKKKAAKKAKQ